MKQIYQRFRKFARQNALCSVVVITASLTMNAMTVTAQASAEKPTGKAETAAVRTIQKKKYKVIDATGFPIYTHQDYVNAAKGSMISKTFYSFSRDTNSEVMPLTRANLKKAFPDKTEFHYALDAAFRNDQQLTAWDKYQQMYKVKYLFLKN